MLFKGWIPTVTGNLSFIAFGDTDYPKRFRRCGTPKNRFCVIQERSLLDIALPLPFGGWLAGKVRELVARSLLKRTGDFFFVILGEFIESKDCLSGYAFIIPSRESLHDRNRVEVKFVSLARKISSDRIAYEAAAEFFQEICLGAANFSIYRTGECSVETSWNYNSTRDRETEEILANQLFFFLKDTFHRHQHHDPTHDAIIMAFPVVDEDDQSWIQKTQHRLYRQIIRYKRYRDHKTLYRASGVLAYTKAFERNFRKTNQIRDFTTDELEESLSVRREEIQHFDQLRLSRHQSLLAWFFSLSAFIISIALLAQLDQEFDLEIHPIINWTTQQVARYPLAAGAFTWATAIALRMIAFREFPSDWPLVRNTYQLLRGSPLERYVALIVILGLLSILTGFALTSVVLNGP